MSTLLVNRFGVPIRGIIHVGANRGQEIEEYARETDRAVFIEAIPELAEVVREKVQQFPNDFHVFAECCSERSGDRISFNVSNGTGDNSSILPLGKIAEFYPDVAYDRTIEVESVALDDLISGNFSRGDFNVLAVDVQGADLNVLKGARQLLADSIDFVYVEVAVTPIYEGGATLDEITDFLAGEGFGLKHLDINIMDWGNALYARNRFLFEDEITRSLTRGARAEQSSTLQDKPDNAADKALTGFFRQGGGARTKIEDQPWWQVDLGNVGHVSHAYWLDRRLRRRPPHPIDVKISDDGESWETVATLEDEEKRSSTALIKRIDLDRPTRFIRLQAQGRHSISVSQFYAMP